MSAMTPEGEVRIEREGPVARLTLARPPLNILTIPMMEALNQILEDLVADTSLKVLVLGAEGRAFCAGVAVEDHMGDRVKPMLAVFHQVFRHLHALDCPTVAEVQGPALGGGAELATFCDVVVASEAATIGQPEIKVGVFPPIAALHYPTRIGRPRTVELLLSGRVLGAREAERIGLVDRVVGAAELEAAVGEVVRGFVDKSAAVLRLAKRAVREAGGERFDAALAELEEMYLWELMQTEDAHEGLRAFMAKRAPVWKDR